MDFATEWRRRQEGDEEEQAPAAPVFTPPPVPGTARDFATDWQNRNAGGVTPAAPTPAFSSPTNAGISGGATPVAGADGTFSSRTMTWFDRGGRFVSSVLSPVMAAQDIAFATAEGLMDPNVSLWENWQELDWANYTPWTPAPIRPTSGADLVRAMGVEDPTVQRYFGLLADLTVDPLAAGAMLRGVSRASGGVTALNRAADAADSVSELSLLVGGVPTARTVRNAAALVPAPVRAHVQANFDRIGATIRPVIDAPFIQANPATGQRDWTIANSLLPEGSRMEGAFDAVSRTRGLAREVGQEVNERVGQMLAAVGDRRAGRWLRDITNGQSLHYQIPRLFRKYDKDVSGALVRSIYDTARQVGINQVDPALSGLEGGVRQFFDTAGQVMQGAGPGAPPSLFQSPRLAQDLLVRESDRLRDLARRKGVDPDELVDSFRYGLQKVAEADAITGYHVSGMGVLREVFWEALQNRNLSPADIRQAWSVYLQEGMAGRGEMWRRAEVVPGSAVKGEDVFGRYGNAFALSADAILANVPQGHLRRSFGMFLTPQQFTRYENALRDGALAPTRILSEQKIIPKLRASNPRLTAMLEDYIDTMTPAGSRGAVGPAQNSSLVLNTMELQESMIRQGVDRVDASNYVRAMIREMNPQLADLAEDVRYYRESRIGDVPGIQPSPAGGRSAFGPRTGMDLDELDVLLEMADPAVSLAESARAGMQAIGTRNAMAELLRLGEGQSAIRKISRNAPAPRGWKTITQDTGLTMPLLAPFAGRALHPTLYREVMNLAAMSKTPSAFARGYQRVRGLVTGGFLANPATTATNFAGGFLTAWLDGLPLGGMARNYVGVLNDIKKQGRNLPEYEAVGDLIEGALTNNNFIQNLPEMKTRLIRNDSARDQISNIGRAFYDAYQNAILRPRGAAKALGLRYFEASEAIMRMAAYRTSIEMGETADRARRRARFVVFDYSSQPRMVETMKNTGLLAFPAFPYFMMGRTVNALLNRPARLAMIERAPGSIWEFAIPDEDERVAAYASLDEWMRDGKYIPIRNKDDGLWTYFPFGQFLPTDTIGRDNFSDSLQSMGLLGPMIDFVAATMQKDGTGEAPMTGRFGRRVFQEGATGPEQFQQTAQFLYNSFAPGWVRKAFRFSETEMAGPTGLIPTGIDFARNGYQLAGPEGDVVTSVAEQLRRRPDRDFLDELIGFTIRSTRPVSAAPGATSGTARQVQYAAQRLERLIANKARAAAAIGDPREKAKAQIRIGQMISDFEERYGPMIEVNQKAPQIFPGVRR